jgi:RNA polymerase sigma-70 factor (ECF subfamily)
VLVAVILRLDLNFSPKIQIEVRSMFENTNHYTLWTEVVDGITRCYVSFTDGQGVHRETEVSRPVYGGFLSFVKRERNLRRWDERHIEQSKLTEETLHRRVLLPPKSAEEAFFDYEQNERLRQAIAELPEVQRRRFLLYHEFGLTYEQIAKVEGCTHVAVIHSLSMAKEKIKKFFG